MEFNKENVNILVADDEPHMLKVFSAILKAEGYNFNMVSGGKEALELMENEVFDLVIADLSMPDIDGIELLKECKKSNPNLGFIIVTGHASVSSAVTAMKEGADDYITKPWEREQLLIAVERTLNQSLLKREINNLRGQIRGRFGLENMVGKSKPMLKLFETTRKVANSEATVLIQGESGTGKELLARAIHIHSPRSEGPLVIIDCASLPVELLQSELFGHTKGAFTGAMRSRRGLFEEARQGTIFLDEIADIPPQVQLGLLRVLQEREIRPLGSDKSVPVDVRVVSASNKNLKEAVECGEFRRDLYYRLAVITLELPPLRKRREDIPTLCQFFLEKYNDLNRKNVSRISPDAMSKLLAYFWEGNVRELENVIERAVVLSETDTITTNLLPPEISADDGDSQGAGASTDEPDSLSLKKISAKASAAMEMEAITNALKQSKGNKKQAAEILGISRGSLYNKLREYKMS